MENNFINHIKKYYPETVFYNSGRKKIVATEKGINFSYIYDDFILIDFIYVFDDVKGTGKLKELINILELFNGNIKIINVVSSVLKYELEKRGHVRIFSSLDNIEIPLKSFDINPNSFVNLSEDEEEMIDCGSWDSLIYCDGIFDDYAIIKP